MAAASAAVALTSLSIGVGLDYIVPQLVALLGLAVLVGLAPRLPFAVALILIATVAKNFALSQLIKVFLWQRADVGMSAPVATAWTIAAGTWGFVLAAAAYSAFRPQEGWSTPLSRPISQVTLTRSAWVLFVIGAVAKATFAGDATRSVIFAYSGNLVYAAAGAFAFDVWKSSAGRRLIDWRVLLVLLTTLLVAMRTGSKFEILTPFAFVALLYLAFKVRPPLRLVIPGLLSFAVLAFVVYPVVTYARATANGPASFVDTVEDVLTHPEKFETIKTTSDQISARWQTRLYYGRSIGILDRFTPNQVADIVAVAPYGQYNLARYLNSSAKALLPQSLGFRRDATELGQAQLESAFQRRSILGENNSNYGLIANLALFGGSQAVTLGCGAFAGLLFGLYTLGFGGQRNDLWALPWGVTGMFSVADQGLAGNLITMVHGAAIQWAITLAVITGVGILGAGARPLRERRPAEQQ